MPKVGGGRNGSIDRILPEGPREKPGRILTTVSRKVGLAWGGVGLASPWTASSLA